MAFYYNRFSGISIEEQWITYYQNKEYIKDINTIVSQNRRELQNSFSNATTEQTKALNNVCGSINDGFEMMGNHLRDINYNISSLRGEINEMASMLDWKLSVLIEEQRITNQLLEKVSKILKIPDSQKQRVYFIEKGLKYLRSAIPDGPESEFFSDALESFLEAEKIERKDFITLNRIGQVHLYSKKYFDIKKSKEYFLKSAREASVEDYAGGTTTSQMLNPIGQISLLYSDTPFRAATAEAYLYASRACYLMQNLEEATQLAGKAYELIPDFLEAGFEQAKYLAANDKGKDAAGVLRTVIKKDRYFSLKTLSDPDLISKSEIVELLELFKDNAIYDANNLRSKCTKKVRPISLTHSLLGKVDKLISKKNFLSAMQAVDMFNISYPFILNNYTVGSGGDWVKKNSWSYNNTILGHIEKENENEDKRVELRSKVQTEIYKVDLFAGIAIGIAAGIVIGFFRGCSLDKFSMDGGTWFNTILLFGAIGLTIGFLIAYFTDPERQKE